MKMFWEKSRTRNKFLYKIGDVSQKYDAAKLSSFLYKKNHNKLSKKTVVFTE